MYRYQFVNRFPRWQTFHFDRPTTWLRLVYDWHLYLGWCEIRKLHKLKPGEAKELRQQVERQLEESSKAIGQLTEEIESTRRGIEKSIEVVTRLGKEIEAMKVRLNDEWD